uniref:Uncharacterized protein n=1 Tax=Alexandrium monilatum TaxID=311494 RepID=A0A7S4RY79_9DINO
MADVAMPPLCAVPADSFHPWLIRITAPKISGRTSDSTALAPVELKEEIAVFARLSTKDVFTSEKGGKLVKYDVDVLLIDGMKLKYQLFKHSVMKNMDTSKSSMSAAGAAVAEATRSCHLLTQGSVGKDGTKITLEGTDMTMDAVQGGHLKCSKEPGVFCRLGRQYSVELQGCDKLSWTAKEGVTKDTTLCALSDCADLL